MSPTVAPVSIGRVLPWLIARGLVDPIEALDGNVSLVDASRSNRVTLVVVGKRPKLVVKQPGPAADEVDSLANEAAAYRWLSQRPATAAIAPGLVLNQSADGVLVVEALADSEPLNQLLLETSNGLEDLFFRFGQVLGTLHSIPDDVSGMHVRRPWVLDVPAVGAPPAFGTGMVLVQTVDRLVRNRSLRLAIDAVARDWRERVVIHGDVKFDNVLVRKARIDSIGEEEQSSTEAGAVVGASRWMIRLIDWELACPGDPSWDLASALEGVLTHQILTRGTVERDVVRPLTTSVVNGHRSTASGDLTLTVSGLTRALTARVAQTAVQLAAMHQFDDVCGELAGRVADLAESLAHDPTYWSLLLPGSRA